MCHARHGSQLEILIEMAIDVFEDTVHSRRVLGQIGFLGQGTPRKQSTDRRESVSPMLMPAVTAVPQTEAVIPAAAPAMEGMGESR